MQDSPLRIIPARRRRTAFSMIEFAVLIGIIALLASIFIPYVSKVREMDRRTRCLNNLRNLSKALDAYAKQNGYLLPCVVHDIANKPNGYTAFTGPDDSNPFIPSSKVSANDVTASLFLLINQGYISTDKQKRMSLFICPSSDDVADEMTDLTGRDVNANQRSNFRSAKNLSYGYCSPFSSSPKFRMNTDWLAATFAVMADKGPGLNPPHDDVAGVGPGAAPLEFRKANSNNHEKAGQNVLYGDGHVDFQRTPYCGYHAPNTNPDNIYTAQSITPTTLPSRGNSIIGFFGKQYAPSNWEDSFIVPSEHD